MKLCWEFGWRGRSNPHATHQHVSDVSKTTGTEDILIQNEQLNNLPTVIKIGQGQMKIPVDVLILGLSEYCWSVRCLHRATKCISSLHGKYSV